MYLDSLKINNQHIHLFDLAIKPAERQRRRAILDSELTDYFFDQEKISYIYHQVGQPAKLRLEPLVLQSLTQPKPVKKSDYRLAISYALPIVAVTWSDKPIAVDLCQQSAFATMTKDEMLDFCQLYFPNEQANIFCDEIAINKRMAQQWSIFEAQLKVLELPLQEYSNQLAKKFMQVASFSQEFEHKGQRYWLTVSQLQSHTQIPHTSVYDNYATKAYLR